MAVNSFNAQNPPVNTKGDLFTFSTIPTKLAVGSANQVLTVDSTTATGLKWAAPAGGSKTMSLITNGTLSSGTVTISSLSSYDQLTILLYDVTQSADSQVYVRINGSSSSIYRRIAGQGRFEGSSTSANVYSGTHDGITMSPGGTGYDSGATNAAGVILYNCKEAGYTLFDAFSAFRENAGTYIYHATQKGVFESNAAVSSISLVSNSSSFTGGSYYVYGA